MKSNTKGSLILILTSFIWGMCFAAQSNASQYIGPFTFVCLRSMLTGAILFAVYPLFAHFERKAQHEAAPKKGFAKKYLPLGGLLGVILVCASFLQQAGLKYTSAAKSGFITALYIVMIPLINLFWGQKTRKKVWIGVCVAIVGLFLLCIQDDLSVNIGDLITLGCAFVFSFHIIFIDRYAGDMNPVLLSAVQFTVGALVSLPMMLLLEQPTLASIKACFGSILYAAVMSGAVGYTLQFVGQRYTEPTLASLLMCLESVFASIGGWILLGQRLSLREIVGCVLMLCASIIAQLPDRERSLNGGK